MDETETRDRLGERRGAPYEVRTVNGLGPRCECGKHSVLHLRPWREETGRFFCGFCVATALDAAQKGTASVPDPTPQKRDVPMSEEDKARLQLAIDRVDAYRQDQTYDLAEASDEFLNYLDGVNELIQRGTVFIARFDAAPDDQAAPIPSTRCICEHASSEHMNGWGTCEAIVHSDVPCECPLFRPAESQAWMKVDPQWLDDLVAERDRLLAVSSLLEGEGGEERDQLAKLHEAVYPILAAYKHTTEGTITQEQIGAAWAAYDNTKQEDDDA